MAHKRLIILAAGMGARLRPLTDDRPKCAVELSGRPLIEWQLAAAREAGVDEVVVVRGYRGDRLDGLPGVRFVDNPRYDNTNMVYSLWCAREYWGSEFVVSYGDIVYEPHVLRAMFESTAPLAVTVDLDALSYWALRFDDPLSDMESLRLSGEGLVTNLGQKPRGLEDIQGQYIGMSRYAGAGVTWLRDLLQGEQDAWAAGVRRLHPTRSFDSLYMTDMLQALVDAGHPLTSVPVRASWLEVDCASDLAVAEEFTRPRPEGTLEIRRPGC